MGHLEIRPHNRPSRRHPPTWEIKSGWTDPAKALGEPWGPSYSRIRPEPAEIHGWRNAHTPFVHTPPCAYCLVKRTRGVPSGGYSFLLTFACRLWFLTKFLATQKGLTKWSPTFFRFGSSRDPTAQPTSSWSPADAGDQISIDRPGGSLRGATGAELRPILSKIC